PRCLARATTSAVDVPASTPPRRSVFPLIARGDDVGCRPKSRDAPRFRDVWARNGSGERVPAAPHLRGSLQRATELTEGHRGCSVPLVIIRGGGAAPSESTQRPMAVPTASPPATTLQLSSSFVVAGPSGTPLVESVSR